MNDGPCCDLLAIAVDAVVRWLERREVTVEFKVRPATPKESAR